MRGAFRFLIIFALCVGYPATVSAQSFDPRPTLGALIQAFQYCGPPATYQLLSPALFQIVAYQTGGSGCYAPIRAAGPVTNMQIVDQRQFPIGPLYVVRVTHPTGSVDWFVGFNQMTSKVEYLSFQPAQVQLPTISTGPSGNTGSNGPSPVPKPQPDPTKPSAGCDLYPAMCQ